MPIQSCGRTLIELLPLSLMLCSDLMLTYCGKSLVLMDPIKFKWAEIDETLIQC